MEIGVAPPPPKCINCIFVIKLCLLYLFCSALCFPVPQYLFCASLSALSALCFPVRSVLSCLPYLSCSALFLHCLRPFCLICRTLSVLRCLLYLQRLSAPVLLCLPLLLRSALFSTSIRVCLYKRLHLSMLRLCSVVNALCRC